MFKSMEQQEAVRYHVGSVVAAVRRRRKEARPLSMHMRRMLRFGSKVDDD